MLRKEISNIQRVTLFIFHTTLLHCMSFGHLVHFITQFDVLSQKQQIFIPFYSQVSSKHLKISFNSKW